MICIQCQGAGILFPDEEITEAKPIVSGGRFSLAFRSRGTGNIQFVKQYATQAERDGMLRKLEDSAEKRLWTCLSEGQPEGETQNDEIREKLREAQEMTEKLQERIRKTEEELEKMREKARAGATAAKKAAKKKQDGKPEKKTKEKVTLSEKEAADIVSGTDLTEGAKEALLTWLAYKYEKHQPYQRTGFKALITKMKNNSGKFGEEAVAELIGDCMSSGYQGITWDRLKKPGAQGAKKGNQWNSCMQNEYSEEEFAKLEKELENSPVA